MDISKIKSELKRQKITYDSLSEMTGISKSAISKIFSGIAINPRAETLLKIEEALGLQSSELARPYLTEQEETLLRSFRALSKKGRSAALELVSVLDSYENN
jgi:transcriptional regulator with XRE-family HTH domain